ncbi:MAG: two-partner secretion domain-containing protein, partial [Burkholderiales bacterium]
MPEKRNAAFSVRERLIAAAISACFSTASAWANPTAPQVVNGSASFNQTGNLLTVTNSNGAIINWNSFSIGASETTRFDQTSSSSSVLNRVITSDPSVLLGTLSSNGQVWLINPSGIMVGQGARIDVAGFVASTLNVANQDFLAGRLNFGATSNATSIQNYGQITTPSGGSVYLVAPSVTNNGIINAPNGEVILAAGQTVQLLDTGTPGVSVAITGAEGNVTNLGQIVSEAGQIGIAGVLVNNSGTLNASSVVKQGGRIFLKASEGVTAGGTISAASDTGQGGQIEVAGTDVLVPDGADLDASGKTQGGTILVGGGYQGKDAAILNASTTTIEGTASLNANATGSGDGGLIVAWSDGLTSVQGSFSARGGVGGGTGGLVETSGKGSLDVAGARVDTRASDGSAGTWLLDPADITVTHASATGSPNFAPTGATSTIADGDINANLVTTDVLITTASGYGGSGNITVDGTADGAAAFIATSGTGSRALTLNADGNISVHAGAIITGTNSAPLTLNLYSSGGIADAGTIYSFGSANFMSKGAISFGDTNGNSGYLNSYGAPITLLANWNGSTTSPDVALSPQCVTSFCGISGSGSIISSSPYISNINAGAVTLKSGGDLDLSNISISAGGGSGSYPAGAGGAGGAVSITSTQGKLTIGNVN